MVSRLAVPQCGQVMTDSTIMIFPQRMPGEKMTSISDIFE